MRKKYYLPDNSFVKTCLAILLCTGKICFAQNTIPTIVKVNPALKQTISQQQVFTDNIGQYGKTMDGYTGMGPIKFGYEGMNMPVLFTSKGLIHLQRKTEKISEKEERRLEKLGVPEDVIEKKKQIIDRVITMEWVGINPDVNIIAEDVTTAYHTYGLIPQKAYGYKKLIYQNAYPGIDIIYSFTKNNKAGFEYSLLVKPGADVAAVKLKYGGDIKTIRTDNKGSLFIKSDIEGVVTSVPVSYYDGQDSKSISKNVKSFYKLTGTEIGFSFPQGYDKSKQLIIDPFVSSTGGLSGVNNGKAKDVDFDYEGNIYVTGGGDGTSYKLSKYDAAGALQWTFNGTTTVPAWHYGDYYGGFVVEKNTGKIYLGQGFSPGTGYRVVRISTSGLYDNYISTGNTAFNENWKMYWSCNNGSPQILVVGGGTSSNLNLGVLTPPSTTISALNITNVPSSCCQDMADMVFDPATNDIYSIFASVFGTPSINNKIFKNAAPYSGASIAWSVQSGYNVLSEANNRPYMANVIAGYNDNSANMLALNASYLFYWDGKNLKAFNKSTGADAGTPLTTANTAMMQGGIIADACNNIFVGEGNGIIKVYNFNGITFSDAPADIAIPGFSGKAVYDLSYDESKKLIYASGDGFVGSFDVAAYCPATTYTLTAVPNCLTASATATVTPAPPGGSVITYNLYNGTTLVTSNTTGVFSGLSPNITYAVIATVNQACSGTQAAATFVIPGPTIGITTTNTTCGAGTGSINAVGSGTSAPYTYSIDGTNFFPSGNFPNLPAGIYTVTVKDLNGCSNTASVTLTNTNGPQLAFTNTNANCSSNNGTVTANATGGASPYQYSINNGATWQINNFFTGLTAGVYTLVVKDANNCINSTLVTITTSPAVFITAIPAAATCGSNNGTITAFGTGGTAPLQYSMDGNNYQPSNIFTGVTPGTYTVYVKDVNGCYATTTVTVTNSPAPAVTATSTGALCNNVNGTITATGTGGIAPLQYSINGVTFQAGNIFTGLAAGGYTVTVKDATGCTNIVAVTVSSTGGPTANAVSTVSACNSNTGTITITASGGVPGYQYSINGTTYQAGNVFNNLAAGNYIAYAKDANGCIGTFSITVANTNGPSITAVATPTSCNANDGIITITAGGGTPGYQYSIDGTTYVAGFIFSGLASGNYIAFVKDFNGCIKSTGVVVNNISGLSLAVSTIVSGCSLNNGVITATATGGAAPLQYSINGTVYQPGNVFTGLASASYTVYVKDNNNCIVTKPATVGSVSGPSLSVSIERQATCGAATGVIRANGSGGLAPLTYNIDGGAFQPINIFINLAPGLHTIIVKDATGCTVSQSVTITNSGAGNAITDVTFVLKDALACTGQTGRIKNLKGEPSGGGNHYEFSLDGGAFTTSNQFNPVSVGTHTITARNDDGCMFTRLVTIGSGVAATATATSTATLCNASTGTITITGIGASTPYHANIDNAATWVTFFPPGGNTFTFTNLSSGTHKIIIADDADFVTGPPDIPGACLTTLFVAVPSTGGPTISTTQVNPTCSANNGSITAVGGGTAGPYTFNIDGGAYFSSGVFNNLAPGVHAVTVKDAAGCITGANVTLSNAAVPTITAALQPATCNLNNGTVTATATGGVPPLQYSINGTIFQSSNVFSNLAPGSYTLYVKDVNECYSTLPVTISNISLPLATAYTIAASCNNTDGTVVASGSGGTLPYTFSINGSVYQSSGTFSNLAAGFYTVYIKDARDCITTTGISVANAGGPAITAASSTPANCDNPTGIITVTASGGGGGIEYSKDGTNFQLSNIFNGLLPGAYIITVRDINGCLNTRAVTVANLPGPQTLTAVVTNAACGSNNGSITATASGGTGALQYSIDGITYQLSNIFNAVPAGGHTLYVRDINLCVKTLAVTVLNLAAPTLSATSSPASCGLSDGTITASATGGTTALTYSKDGISFQASNIFTGLAANSYLIRVKDARGCRDSSLVTVNTTNAFSGLLAAATGGPQVSTSAVVVPTGTTYLDTFCNLIARVVPSGAFPAGGSISSKVIIDPSVQTYNNEPYVQRHFDIEPATNAATSTATVTLYFKDQEFQEFNLHRTGFPPLPTVANGGNADPSITNVRVTQYHGVPIAPHNAGNPAPGYYTNSAGVLIVPTSVNYNSTFNYWEVTITVNGFSGFYVHTNLNHVLPITLNYFNGTRQGNNHLLNWKVTCDASPSVTLILERGTDGTNFNSLYNITATAVRCNQPFDYMDAAPLPGVNYYRLKMVSADGSSKYSNIVALTSNRKGVDIISISPNPVINGTFNLDLFSNATASVEISITDMQGRVVEHRMKNVTSGINSIGFNVPYLAAGTYTISVTTEKDKSRVLRFVKE
ncbi:MAG: T9SS type A sorting domain-containing protein [Chitinophagaceae bacterium]|nr:T9SS type A sorting domain-containing protein [Chitinophagaceae bacterium]